MTPAEKVGPYGGSNGAKFDHGTYDGVKMVTIGANRFQILYLEVTYAKVEGYDERRSQGNRSKDTDTFVVDWPAEYLISVHGTYGGVHLNQKVTSLKFKTSGGKSSPVYGTPGRGDKAFAVMGRGGAPILGFHGHFGAGLSALGAHVFVAPSKILGLWGGSEGIAWDDGIYDGVRKVLVGDNSDGNVSYLKFEYAKGDKSVEITHGIEGRATTEFVLEYPNEHIAAVEGTYDCGLVTSLSFKTSNGRSSPVAGKPVGKGFSLEQNGSKLVGFRGRSSHLIIAVGAHFAPRLVPAKKLDAKGGNGGQVWDDGSFDEVRKIYVGYGKSGLTSVKFEYVNVKQLVEGETHGDKSDEFELDSPNEYITSVQGSYKKVEGVNDDVVTMLRFKTNKRTSPPYGLDWGTKFELGEKGHKIVGFHGKASDLVHQLGVHVSPISKS